MQRKYNVGEITKGEIEAALKATSGGKAAGCDGIPAEVWKVPGMADQLVGLFNQCLSSGTVPADWKTLLVVPVPKQGDLSQPTNYRGISLMCNIAKLYNKVILLRLRSVLEEHLLTSQNGFRPGRSTITHIVALRALLQHVLANANLGLIACFVDFSKAFDSVNWDYMRAILGAYQIPDLLVNAIMALYEGVQARVKINGGAV